MTSDERGEIWGLSHKLHEYRGMVQEYSNAIDTVLALMEDEHYEMAKFLLKKVCEENQLKD